jgi:hypothetical protein
LATTVATIVERQLTQFAATISQRFEALTADIQRLGEVAADQQARIDELDRSLANIPARLQQELPGFIRGATEQMQVELEQRHVELSDTVEQLELRGRRADEQAAAIVQHLNDTTAALAKRMDEGDANLAQAVEERLTVVRQSLESIGPEVQRQVADNMATVVSKLEYVESATVDKIMAAEGRINEVNGTRIAQLEATIGRIGSGFDDSMIAFNQRLLDQENRAADVGERFAVVEQKVANFDESAFDELKGQMSNAIGEAMLVRIEMDRNTAAFNESMDKTALRLADIESKLDDEMDVSAAVQLERLDEMERALSLLDPSKFVMKDQAAFDAEFGKAAPTHIDTDPTANAVESMLNAANPANEPTAAPASDQPPAAPAVPDPSAIPSLTL